MKPMSKVLQGCALALVATLAAACNPFEGLDPRSSSSAGHSASEDMCAVDANLGRCPSPPPSDFLP